MDELEEYLQSEVEKCLQKVIEGAEARIECMDADDVEERVRMNVRARTKFMECYNDMDKCLNVLMETSTEMLSTYDSENIKDAAVDAMLRIQGMREKIEEYKTKLSSL